ncbi:uncharacterized protein LOC115381733 isoform X3 [Salarias fasciatus]|uniref:uncharacterized protein LOC115381733 isoform X3 n=1 Tax=Salarias fasciatus TaxID=181472 RepID=UPI001176BE54|nr:uncharacterized protein LOC115381733 isoform X3 [Salarias fasciatus]
MMMTCVVILCSSVLLRLSIQEGRCCDCESSGRILGEGCSWWLGGWLGGGCGGGGFDYDVKTSDVKTSDVITAYCNVMENMRQHDRDKRFCPIRSSWTRPVVWTHIRAAVEDETVPASQLSGGGMFLVQQPRSPQLPGFSSIAEEPFRCSKLDPVLPLLLKILRKGFCQDSRDVWLEQGPGSVAETE